MLFSQLGWLKAAIVAAWQRFMRILHCIHSLDPRGGGPADFVRQAASLQKSHGFEMEVACLDAVDSGWLKEFPARVHAFGPGAGNYGYCKGFVPWLKAQKTAFDAVVVNGIWQYSSFGSWLALNGGSVPYVVFPHGMLDPWFNESYPLKRLKKQMYWIACESHVLSNASAVFFTADTERERSARSFVPYNVNAVTVPYGTNPPSEDLAECRQGFFRNNPELDGKLIVAYLGRLHEKKGCDLLVRAFNMLADKNPHLRLVIAGPGDASYCATLDQAIAGNPAVTRLNLLAGKDKWGLLAAADALILPSHQENFARVVAEALSCSTPALLSDKVNIHGQVVQDGAGIAAPDTLEGTTQLLVDFLSLSSDQRDAMRRQARETYEKRFNLSKNFSEYLQILSSYCKLKP